MLSKKSMQMSVLVIIPLERVSPSLGLLIEREED